MTTLAVLPPREYICPGHRSPISRAVHLARLAAAFPACSDCPYREPTGRMGASGRHGPILAADGLRGVYRNEFDAAAADRVATALAAMLWHETDDAGVRPPPAGHPVVVGYDDRPWSTRIAAEAGRALRRSGCETIDIGPATGPAFRFAVAHLEAAAGILATGAGGGPAIAGVDIALAGGRPLSAGGTLDRLGNLAASDVRRTTRLGGHRRQFDVTAPYHAGLIRHFGAPSVARGVVGTSSGLVRDRLQRLMATMPMTLRIVSLARRAVDADGADIAGLDAIAAAVREESADLGLWIDDDGTSCRLVDETGRTVPVTAFASLLLDDALSARPSASIVVDWPLGDRLGSGVLRRRETVSGNGTAEAMFVSMRDIAAVAGVDSTGRFWTPGPPVNCDALISLARLLRILGRGGEPLSRRLRSVVRSEVH